MCDTGLIKLNSIINVKESEVLAVFGRWILKFYTRDRSAPVNPLTFFFFFSPHIWSFLILSWIFGPQGTKFSSEKYFQSFQDASLENCVRFGLLRGKRTGIAVVALR